MTIAHRDQQRSHVRLLRPFPPEPVDRDAFLSWADGQEGRFELVRGQIAMMPGTTRRHATVTMRLAALLMADIDETKHQVVAIDLGVQTNAGIRYPDILIEPAGLDGRERTAKAPIFLAEILSPSSVSIDMIEKAAEYTAIETLRTYAVLNQDEMRAWVWQRGETGGWPERPTTIEGPEAVLDIPALGVTVPLASVYRGVAD